MTHASLVSALISPHSAWVMVSKCFVVTNSIFIVALVPLMRVQGTAQQLVRRRLVIFMSVEPSEVTRDVLVIGKLQNMDMLGTQHY